MLTHAALSKVKLDMAGLKHESNAMGRGDANAYNPNCDHCTTLTRLLKAAYDKQDREIKESEANRIERNLWRESKT